ncbi:MAG: hypothetical protein ILO42_06880 [Clostridia bacterium]|nr:hypothetical protein [Clostridia bacterium]
MKRPVLLRTAAALTAAVLILLACPLGAFSADAETVEYEITDADKQWYDAAAPEYTISTKGELAFFAELAKTNSFAGKTVRLGADIVWNDGEADAFGFTAAPGTRLTGWNPIGPGTSNPFQGVFDGQGHTISGIYIKSNAQNMGLFGVIKNSTIRDLKLSDCYIELYKDGEPNPSWAGIVASQSWGDNIMSGIVVTNSYLLGDIAESSYLGALVGCAASASGKNEYKNCSFTGAIRGKDAVGGLIGLVRNKKTAVITNCVCDADITAATDCGGIVGRLCGNCELRNTFFLGTVTCDTAGKSAGLCYLEKKDQGGTAQVDPSTALFADCYTQSDLAPVASAPGESKYDVSAGYDGAEPAPYALLGTDADAAALAALFKPLTEVSGTQSVYTAAAQEYTADGKRGARLVAAVRDIGQAKYAGFNISVMTSGGRLDLGNMYCTQIFGVLEERGGAATMTATSLGAGHLFALSFRGIPEEGCAIFVATPFTGTGPSSPAYGRTSVAVFINGYAVCFCDCR